MATQHGIIRLRGTDKSSDTTFVKTKGGTITRKARTPGSKKDEPALQLNNGRAGFLNSIASAINEVAKMIPGLLKDSEFYSNLLSPMFESGTFSQLIALSVTKGINASKKLKYEVVTGDSRIIAEPERKNLRITVHIRPGLFLPPKVASKVKSFHFFIIVMWWNESGFVSHQIERTDWLPVKNFPACDGVIDFRRPEGANDYLILGGCELVDKTEGIIIEREAALQPLSAGSFDKASQKLLAEFEEGRKRVSRPGIPTIDNVKRIKLTPVN